MTGAYWDQTLNVVIGCDPVSAGCDFCFAVPTGRIRAANPNPKVAAAFAGTVTPTGRRLAWTGKVNELADRLNIPFLRRKPTRYYLTLLGDLFHAGVSEAFIARVFAMVAVTGRHTYLCTTKRHGRMQSLLNNPRFVAQVAQYADEYAGRKGAVPWDGRWPLRNLHLAVSVEDQSTANLRIPHLLDTPATVRWISAEPLLRRITLCRCDPAPLAVANPKCPLHGAVRLDWVVTGGESGSPRPTHPDHVRALRDECIPAGVPFFFKQWGDHLPLTIVDRPDMLFGRAYQYGGWHAIGIREPGPTGTMRTAVTRPMQVGERNKGGVLLSQDVFAKKVGAKTAGRQLDGRTWDQMPAVRDA